MAGHASLRGTAAVVALLVAVTSAALAPAPTAAAVEATSDPPGISVVTTPAATTGPCLPAPFALRQDVRDEPGSFTLRIHVTAPPCEPIPAAAVVYGMPGGGVAWPQTLRQRRDLVIDRPGTVEVTFAKGCDPVQFDVITGASPATISPWGPWHGPMLFPFDTGTARQYWGQGPACPPPVIPEFPLPAVAAAAAGAVGLLTLTRIRRRHVAG